MNNEEFILSGSHLRLVESSDEFHQGVWQYQKMLVVSKESVFHDRCVICDAEANGRTMRKTLFWHSPLLLPLLILSLPFYFLLAVGFRKTITTRFPLCFKHWALRVGFTLLGVVLFPAGLFMGVYAITMGTPIWILLGILCALSGVGILGYIRNPVWALLIRDEHAVVRGAHPDFVEHFPPWERGF